MQPLRRSGLVVERALGQVLVRDLDRHTSYPLNEAAFAVFELCDGATTAAAMVRRLSAAGLPGADADLVQLALRDLMELGLVAMDRQAPTVSRRTLLRRLGTAAGAAALLPVVEALAGRSGAALAATITVIVGPGNTFSPSNVTISVGDIVTFQFAGVHTATEGAGCTPANPLFNLSTNGSVTFTTAGTFPFFCDVSDHCELGQRGTITVMAAPSPSPNPHFVSASASVNPDGSLTVSWKEAGLGDNQLIDYRASADATATYVCVNNGGGHPSATNKTTVSGPESATGTFASGKNGNITASLTLSPPPPPPPADFSCPSGQTLQLALVSYTNVAITDLTNGITEPIPSPVSRCLLPNVRKAC